MSNKTISINPSLFSLNGSKTKKNREKKQRPIVTPLISPNVLKNKLLKRIKEHKLRETENLDNKKKNSSENIENSVSTAGSTSISNTNDSFSDEFSESINYLQTLSKQKKINDEKRNFEAQKQQRRNDLDRKTIKNRQLYDSHIQSQPFVNIDLPEELQQPLIKVNTEQLVSDGTFSLKSQVPYGILKGGQKPTYRDWTRTQRNGVVTNPNAALTVQPVINTVGIHMKSERENRLQNLREKMKMKQLEESMLHQATSNKDVTNNDIMMTQNLIQKPRTVQSNFIEDIEPVVKYIQNGMIDEDSPTNSNDTNVKNDRSNIVAIKRITKKTIKRKYTLGKSKMSKSVAVLVKDRGTRKQILNAQKDLKRKQINDIKTYLREHNLIKVGSNAPNDVLRKLYESAMLAGEITNSNTDTLLYNFSKSDK